MRRQAYLSLSTYDFAALEALGALRALRNHAALLRAEGDGAALPACEALVSAALQYEHST